MGNDRHGNEWTDVRGTIEGTLEATPKDERQRAWTRFAGVAQRATFARIPSNLTKEEEEAWAKESARDAGAEADRMLAEWETRFG